MKQFVIFILSVFSILFLLYVYRDESSRIDADAVLKVYAPPSFSASWGPGPELKSLFQKKTGQKMVFLEMKDPNLTLQKIAFDGASAIGDVVVGLDQFDIVRSADKVTWKPITIDKKLSLPISLDKIAQNEFFIPYDWSGISFVVRDTFKYQIQSLNDLLQPELKNKIAYEDPRTSSPGLQFLLWVAKTKTETEAIQYLKDLNKMAHSFSPSWSTAYGLFKEKKAESVLSYMTSPVYHFVEERNDGFKALEFKEGHPVQVEFSGILNSCHNCEIAFQFIHFLQTREAQHVLMSKNYMMPVDRQVLDGTPYDSVRVFKLLDFEFTTKDEINKWLKLWTDIRANED